MQALGSMKIAGQEQTRAGRAPKLGRYILTGVLWGAAYSIIDQYLDATLAAADVPDALKHLHNFVDLVLPLLAGGVLGAALYFLQVRAAKAHGEAQRADELHARLTRVERDQAVWVVVASTLHEIKNPLHALGLLLTEVLDLRADEQPTRVELLQRMNQQLGRVQKNVDALRSLSVRAVPRPETVELCAAARAVSSDLLRALRTSAPELVLRGLHEAPVKADPTHLRVILENLIANALEAVEAAENPTVTLDVEAEDTSVRLRISDNGPGVPPELRADLFEPLATSKSRGLGLGLPIARALARAMGGDVALADPVGSASCFVLSLPRDGT